MAYLLDIMGSTIIAGMVISILLAVNISNTSSSSVIMFSTIEQQKITDVAELVQYDFFKIGYRVSGEKISIADSNEIKFYSDIADSSTIDSVHYYIGNTSDLYYTTNPNDKPLYRQRDGVLHTTGTPIHLLNEIPVVDFHLSYYDSIGNMLDYSALTNSVTRELIKSIKVEIKVESDEMYAEEYRASEWKKKISPKNLR
jgi:hypothetical protein